MKWILVGAGLANILIALRIRRERSRDRVVFIDSKPGWGVGRTWSFHESDVPNEMRPILCELAEALWEETRVRFDGEWRTFNFSRYGSMTSKSVSQVMSAARFERQDARVLQVSKRSVTLDDGTRIDGDVVLDGRGLEQVNFPCGFQSFFGLRLRFEENHGIRFPILMDTDVSQAEGFHFVYALPYSSRELLMEDTLYTSSDSFDEKRAKALLAGWIERHCPGLKYEILEEERGRLPLPKGRSFWNALEEYGSQAVGVRAGFMHWVTGYSVPCAADVAVKLVHNSLNDPDQIYETLLDVHSEYQNKSKFYMMLNRMLFDVATSEEKIKVFKRFLKHPESLIQRFYSVSLNERDKVRMLAIKPPISVLGAARALVREG